MKSWTIEARGPIAAAVALVLAVQAVAAFASPKANQGDANPLGMYVAHVVPSMYTAGEAVEVSVIINFAAADTTGVTAMGFSEEIPPGWSFQSMGSLIAGLMPTITPQPGNQEVLGFAWITIPPDFPYQFTYFLLPAEDAAGQVSITGWGEYRTSGGPLQSNEDTVVMNGLDTTPPRITLLGPNPMTIEEGDPYVEPGYRATDNVDGDVTSRVQVQGQVNTEVVGTYTLTYTVSDAAGNAASPVSRSIIVVERQADGGGGGGGGTVTPGGGKRPRRGGGYYGRGYGYYADNYDPTQQPDKQGQEQSLAPEQQAGQTPKQPGVTGPTVGSSGMPGTSSGPMTVALDPNATPPDPGALSAGGIWPLPTTPDQNAPKVGGPNASAPEKPADETPANAPTAAAAAPETLARAAAPADAAATPVQPLPPLAAPAPGANLQQAAPVASETPQRGFFAGIAAAISAMQPADWVRMGVVGAVLVVIGVFATVAWRFAYSPAPQRKNGHANGKNQGTSAPAKTA